jgi:long-chain acyl-CoA synthetase
MTEATAAGMSYVDAVAATTAPGRAYETRRETIEGVGYTVFANAPRSLREVFGRARSYEDRTFLVYEDERWSFGDVMARVDALAAVLTGHFGVRKGDRVAVAMRNYPEWIVSFAAATSVGAISVSMNAWWTEEELDYALGDCGATVLIADEERCERAAAPADRRGIRILGVRLPASAPGPIDRWEDLVRPGPPMPDVDVGPDDDATILYTSGTTGHPKGAVSTHRAVLQALMGFGCRAAVDSMRTGTPPVTDPAGLPVFILVVPLFHVTGCVPVMLSCFASGLKLVIMHRWDPERALELIERERVTNFVGVPTQSWDLLECPRFAEFDTSSLKSVGGGGAPAPPELVRRVATNFAKARPGIGYGMTETNAYGPQNGGEDYLARPTSAGRATPILEIEVRDADRAPVAAGKQGEIWFKGPNLIRGYWDNPEATAETLVDGWLRSGDLGFMDDDGFVYVVDRAKDMILRAGENVYCAEVEAVLYEHPAVYEAAVFGVPHERLGEDVAAAVVPKAGQAVTAEALREHVGKHLAPFKVPSQILLMPEPLPRNAAGKFLKTELRARVVGGA